MMGLGADDGPFDRGFGVRLTAAERFVEAWRLHGLGRRPGQGGAQAVVGALRRARAWLYLWYENGDLPARRALPAG